MSYGYNPFYPYLALMEKKGCLKIDMKNVVGN